MVVIPQINIHADRIVFFSTIEDSYNIRSKKQNFNEFNLRDNSSAGFLSSKSAKKIKTAIDLLLYISQNKKVLHKKSGKYYNFKINFVTLTLSSTQQHSDQFIKDNLLKQFLTECKQKFNVVHYLWRAEAQANGNIHFHIVTDKFLPWSWIRSTWNRIQDKHDYIAQYAASQRHKFRNGFFFDEKCKYKSTRSEQLKRYKKAKNEDFYNPNSTDVHSIKAIRNISAYLAKYCTKNSPDLHKPDISKSKNRYYKATPFGSLRAIEGNTWNLSNSLSSFKPVNEHIDADLSAALSIILSVFAKNYKYYDYVSVLWVPVHVWSKFCKGKVLKLFDAQIDLLLAA